MSHSSGSDVLQGIENDAIGQIRGEIELACFDLFMAVIVGKADGYFAGRCRNQDIQGMRERGPLLEVVVTDEPKSITLGEDSGFIIDRAVPKAKDKRETT